MQPLWAANSRPEPQGKVIALSAGSTPQECRSSLHHGLHQSVDGTVGDVANLCRVSNGSVETPQTLTISSLLLRGRRGVSAAGMDDREENPAGGEKGLAVPSAETLQPSRRSLPTGVCFLILCQKPRRVFDPTAVPIRKPRRAVFSERSPRSSGGPAIPGIPFALDPRRSHAP